MSAANAALAMPYPGLRPFEDKDQPLFFGREAQVSDMLLQLEDHRFVTVVGSSGSGKSSLVRAGLLLAVREGFLLGTTDWLTIIIKPGHQPYERLVRALSLATCRTEGTQVVPAYDDPLTPDETATLATLRRTDRGLLTVLDQLGIPPARKVMVVVDQFEELFAFRRTGVNRDTVASRDESAAFVGMLIRSASEPAGRVWAILTMRSDFIGDCEAFLGLPEQISHSQFLVPRLDRRQMEEAIAQPAAVEEGAFETFTFEEGLVNRIINDAGDRPDQLPLMQHALMRTWKHAVARAGANGHVTVMPEDYEAAGGIEMALSLHADAAWDEIKGDPKKADLARRLFLLLCDISSDGQITRRRPQVTEIQAVTGASVTEIEQVVRVFQQDDRNFLLPPPPQPLTAESYLDISHEALLRQWRLFAGEWQERERSDAGELRRLAELASLRKQGQDVGLLPAQDLERISRWEQRVSAEWARRYVTKEEWDEALRFVEESQSEAKRKGKEEQRRKLVKLAYLVGIIVLAALGFYFWQEMTHAQEALFQPFLRTIGSSSDVMPTVDERESLWDLATLREPDSLWDLVPLTFTNAKVPGKVIDGWFKDEKSSVRALRRHAQGLHAAVRLDADVRKHSELTAKNCADQLTEKLEQETDPDRLSRLGSALAELAAMMELKDAASVALRGADVLAKALENSHETDPESRLGTALAGLATGMEPMEPKNAASFAKRGADVLVKALENSQEADPDRLSRLGTALEALAARVEPVEAGRFASSLAKLLKNPTETSAARLAGVGTALGAFAARMKPNDTEIVATNGAQALAKALEKPQATDANRLWDLGKALAPLAARMESNTAARVADGLANALENAEATDKSRLWSLGCALTQIAVRMKPEDAGPIGISLARALGKRQETSADRLWSLSTALVALTGRMKPGDAALVEDQLTTALEKPEETSADRLRNLSQALAAAAAQAEPEAAAARGVEALAKAVETLQATDADRLASLASALGVLPARMDVKIAGGAADLLDLTIRQTIATALDKPQVIDTKRINDLAGALAALAARMERKNAATVAARCSQAVVEALDTPQITDSASLSGLGWVLGRLSPLISDASIARQMQLVALSNLLLDRIPDPPKIGEIEPKERKQLAELYATLGPQDLAEVLKWPFCVGEAQKLALAELEKKTGREFGGDIWKFVEQAPSLGIKDLDAPAKRPEVEDALKELKSVAAGG